VETAPPGHRAGLRACEPPEKQKRSAVNSLATRLAKSATVEVKKSLTVILPNREIFVADVKAYSPPLAERSGKKVAAGRGPVTESGKDVAILKIDARNLPRWLWVIPTASSSASRSTSWASPGSSCITIFWIGGVRWRPASPPARSPA